MIFDYENLFSDDQAITATAVSESVVKLQDNTGADTGTGKPVNLRLQVTEAFNTLTSLTVAVETDDDEAFGTAVELVSTSLVLASLTVGAVFPIHFLPRDLKKYARITYTVVGTDPTTGKITAGVVVNDQDTNIGG